MNALDPFGFRSIRPNAPYTVSDAIDEIKEVLGREPYNDEVNDWLYEMNEPFSHDDLYLEVGLPGYTETYGGGSNNDSYLCSTNIFILLAAAGVGAYAAYRRNQQRQNSDDEFVKTNNNSSLLGKLRNPFNRKNNGDGDDDFDKVL